MSEGRRLYHYTARHHADEIMQHGAIDRGGVSIPDRSGNGLLGVVRGYQWLTTDATWAQGWNTRTLVRCDRTECRLVVLIPERQLHRLSRWTEVARDFGYRAEVARRFAALGTGSDPTTWYVFEGPIPYEWVALVEDRPKPTAMATDELRVSGL
jgi:hypothetical protein